MNYTFNAKKKKFKDFSTNITLGGALGDKTMKIKGQCKYLRDTGLTRSTFRSMHLTLHSM